VTAQSVLLKQLLQERHWQTYWTFCREYNKAARTIDKELVDSEPSRAQLHRWLSGDLKGLPYAHHCRVLEAMFPRITSAQMFEPMPDASKQTEYPASQLAARIREPGNREPDGRVHCASLERPVGLRPHVEAAFAEPHVSIIFAGFSGETLRNTLSEVLDKVRAGSLRPESITVRMLLCDLSAPLALPVRADSGHDDPAVRRRADRITRRAVESIVDEVTELGDLALVGTATVEVRAHATAPLFKLYLLNDTEAFFGFYPVLEHMVLVDGSSVPIYDPMGKDATLFHFSSSDDDATSSGPQYVAQAKTWFDSIWNTVARPYEPR
jgi:hypothetical protein